MAWPITKNLAQSSLASGYTAGNSSITVQTGDGSKFDAPGAGNTIALAIGNPPQFFLRATAVSSDTFTVDTGGFDGSTAVSVVSGTAVTQVITAQVLRELLTSGPAKLSVRQSVFQTSGSTSITLPINVAAGNYVVVAMVSAAAATGFSDGVNTYTTIKNASNGGTSCILAYALMTTSASITITATGSPSFTSLTAFEFVPLPGFSGTLDTSASNVTSNQRDGLTLTTTGAVDVILFADANGHNVATGPLLPSDGSFVFSGGNGGTGLCLGYLVVVNPGTYWVGVADSQADSVTCAGALK